MTTITVPGARVRRMLRQETTSGVLLLVAALAAIVWANTPWRDGYAALSETIVGPAALHLDLSLATWAADGLLAIFFFVVGVELKHEIVAGALRDPRQAAVPVLAAVGGMALPAILFAVVVLGMGDPSAASGWAIPTATDIAFALAILAVFGRGLPVPLRTFLLTLAVVDDLLAITVIAVFYTASIDVLALAGALVAVAIFGVLSRLRRMPWWAMVPVALVAWWLMHEAGVHATVAGVLLGATIPARVVHGELEPRTHRVEHLVRPVSSGIALPIFAFFAAGVTVVGGSATALLTQPVALGIMLGLVVGKLLGVLGVTILVTRLTPLRLPDGIGIRDLVPVAFLTGIGFTVSLLIAELSFPDAGHTDAAKLAVLVASTSAAILAAGGLRWDARRARSRDMNEDGVPDRPWPLIGDPEPASQPASSPRTARASARSVHSREEGAMSDEHVQGTDPDLATEEVASGGHQDRAEQWEKDDGAGTHHDATPQDTADQWAGSGPEATEDAAEQWSGDAAAPGAQDTAAQWYDEGDQRVER